MIGTEVMDTPTAVRTAPAATFVGQPSEETDVAVDEQAPIVKKAVIEKRERRPLEIYNPEDHEPPTQGMPKYQYELHLRKQKRNPDYIIPYIAPTAAEAKDRQIRRIARKEGELYELANMKPRILTVANTKGGVGKTPAIAYCAYILQEVARTGGLIIDANENGGTLHDYIGIKRSQTILLQEAVAKREEFRKPKKLVERAYRTRPGMYFIGSDPVKKLDDSINIVQANDGDSDAAWPKLTIDSFNETVEIFSDGFSIVLLDNGNGLGDVSTFGCPMMADAILLPTVVEKPSSFGNLVTTMLAYKQYGFDAKIKNGFTIINGTHPGDTKKMYLDKLESIIAEYTIEVYSPETGVKTEQSLTLSDFGFDEDRLFLIPFSQHIKDEKPVSIDPKVIGYDTYEAYLDLLITIFKQNAKYQPMKLHNPVSKHALDDNS